MKSIFRTACGRKLRKSQRATARNLCYASRKAANRAARRSRGGLASAKD